MPAEHNKTKIMRTCESADQPLNCPIWWPSIRKPETGAVGRIRRSMRPHSSWTIREHSRSHAQCSEMLLTHIDMFSTHATNQQFANTVKQQLSSISCKHFKAPTDSVSFLRKRCNTQIDRTHAHHTQVLSCYEGYNAKYRRELSSRNVTRGKSQACTLGRSLWFTYRQQLETVSSRWWIYFGLDLCAIST